MFTKTLALTGAFAALASAVPHNKRDVVWVTKVEEDVVTVPVTTTVWVDPTGAPAHFGHNHGGHGGHKHQTTVESTVNVYPSAAPAPSSEAAPSPYSAPSVQSSAAAPASEVAPASSVEQASSAAPTPSSTYVAPTTSTSVYVAPTSPSVYVAPTTSSSVYVAPTTSEAPASSSAAPASYGGSGSGLSYGMAKAGTSYEGDFTHFDPSSGACGMNNDTSQAVVAVSHVLFDSYSAEANGNPNHNPICKQWITVQAKDGSKLAAQVVDRCVGCDEGALDMSLSLFNDATSDGNGRVHNMKWSFD